MAPSSRVVRPPSRSRFQEGSMRDRASAVPPNQFLDVSSSRLHPLFHPAPQEPSVPKKVGKRGSKQFLGQVLGTVRDRLRGKKKDESSSQAGKKESVVLVREDEEREEKMSKGEVERPKREDIEASYRELVASGFFAQHAIQGTRQPPPAGRKIPPQWPLSPVPSSPGVKSPASTGSRGTKRAMIDDEDNADPDTEEGTPRKLRKSSSSLAPPKLRSSGRRSVSTSNPITIPGPLKESNKLTKRMPSESQAIAVPDRVSSSSRNIPVSTRVLRPRRSAGNVVVVQQPDANRGIPGVPKVPDKFTFGEDRENNGPWRGLRVRNSNLN